MEESMPAEIIPFPIKTGRYETPQAIKFDCLSVPPKEGPLKLHFVLANEVELVIPIEDELVYDVRKVLNAVNPPIKRAD